MKFFRFIFLLALILTNFVSVSQDSKPEKKPKLYHNYLENERKWNWEIPIWIPGFRGEFAYGDISLEGEDGTTPVPEHPIEKPKPGDIFKRLFKSQFNLNFVFMSRISFTSNKFHTQIDGFSGSVGRSTIFRTNNAEIINARFNTNMYRFYCGYAVIEKWSKSGKLNYRLYPYAGIRMQDINVIADIFENKASIKPFWIEPLIGFKNDLNLKRWQFVLNGDVGFFGSNKQFSSMINLNSYFRISNLVSVKAGWTHWYSRLNKNYLDENLKLEMNLSGPAAAVSFHF